MADQAQVSELLKGAFDTHVHSAPDVLPRRFDDIELAKRTRDAGMAGFVLKSHYICTADRATRQLTLLCRAARASRAPQQALKRNPILIA